MLGNLGLKVSQESGKPRESGNFCLFRGFFHLLFVFAPSLPVRMFPV